MNVIEEARVALDLDPQRVADVARKHGIDPQDAVEKIAHRRAVLDAGGQPAARMASVILNRSFKGVATVPRPPRVPLTAARPNNKKKGHS